MLLVASCQSSQEPALVVASCGERQQAPVTCVLVQMGGHRFLVDAGIGAKQVPAPVQAVLLSVDDPDRRVGLNAVADKSSTKTPLVVYTPFDIEWDGLANLEVSLVPEPKGRFGQLIMETPTTRISTFRLSRDDVQVEVGYRFSWNHRSVVLAGSADAPTALISYLLDSDALYWMGESLPPAKLTQALASRGWNGALHLATEAEPLRLSVEN